MDGSVWRLKHGEDFRAKPRTFITSARAQAKRRSGTLRTRILSDSEIVIQFRPER
jgi:hypothetical protein